MSDFRSLQVYRRAAALSDEIHRCVSQWPSFEQWTLGVQLVRATDSIGANIAEGLGRQSNADQRRFILIARGSISEAEHWLMRATARGLLESPAFENELREIGRMLSGLLRAFRGT